MQSNARGVHDVSGRGLVGLALGVLFGFFASYYWLIPLFPKIKTVGILTLMTALVVAAMTVGGAVGYLTMRRTA